MAVDRTPITLRSRLEVQFFRRPQLFSRWAWTLAGICALLPLIWVGYCVARGDRAAFQAGPLSQPHLFIANDCARCHDTWGTAERLIPFGSHLSGNSIRTAGCMECHQSQATAHHANQIPAHADLSCGACHVEHRGDNKLAVVDDRACLQCHRDLKVKGDREVAASKRIWNHVGSFNPVAQGGHPEFAVHRLNAPELDPTDPFTRMLASSDFTTRRWVFERVAKDRPCTTSKPGRPVTTPPKWGDKTNLRFPHSDHIFLQMSASAEGVVSGVKKVTKVQDAEVVKWLSLEPTSANVQANCQLCHAADSEGRYIQPINYEKHCQNCHNLEVNLPVILNAPSLPQQTILPHEKPEIVRGYLVNLVSSLSKRNAQPPDEPERPIPGSNSLPLADYNELAVGQLTSRMRNVEHTIFGPEAKARCAYCHTIRLPGPAEPVGLKLEAGPAPRPVNEWVVEPPNIPDRWLPGSRFRHRSHLFMNCIECHDGIAKIAAADPNSPPKSPGDLPVIAGSSCTVDINLPKIESCFACHAQSASARSVKEVGLGKGHTTGAVTTKCIDCHVYHARK